MDKRIQVSIRYKGKHFTVGDEFKTEEMDDRLTIGQQIGIYIDEQLNYLTDREGDDDNND